MPSHLRIQSSIDPQSTQSFYPKASPTSPPAKKQKMSLTQTYYIASTARTKLGKEAGRPDHDLRLLVGHANLLDSLMIELADAEREQERWFNETLHKSRNDAPRHVQWMDTLAEEMDDDSSDSDSDSDIYEEDEDLPASAPQRRAPSPPPAQYSVSEIEYDDDEDSDYEDDESLSLRRVPSHHPPELVHEHSDSDSDDESMPPSPPQTTLEFTEKQRQAIATTSLFDKTTTQLFEQELLMSERVTSMITAY
ncbi:hypothetical protein H2203_007226 [Taxawa tesnikishii (nom. ined.)]|nr:hypothetical protein H2203_007226 [Dothideales sp. JES 119]